MSNGRNNKNPDDKKAAQNQALLSGTETCWLAILPKEIWSEVLSYSHEDACSFVFAITMVVKPVADKKITLGNNRETYLFNIFNASKAFADDYTPFKLAKELAHAVANADADPATGKVQKILAIIRDKPELGTIITMRVKNIKEEDCGRIWGKKEARGVSPLELSAWMGDFTISDALLKYVPQQFKQEALNQLYGVKNDGLEYGEMMQPTTALVQEYKNFFEQFDKFIDWNERYNYFINKIGKLQLFSTKFVLQWYCDPEGIEVTTPKFDREPERICKLKDIVYDNFSNSGLGTSFYIEKFSGGGLPLLRHMKLDTIQIMLIP